MMTNGGSCTAHHSVDDARVAAARADISEGFYRYLVEAVEIAVILDRVTDANQPFEREAMRVETILHRDRADDRAERRRQQAEIDFGNGRLVSLSDATIDPTPEQVAKGNFRPYTVDARKGTARSVHTVRRVQIDRLVNLHSRGVLDDDTFAACAWYRKTWERAGLNVSAGVTQWGESVGSKHEYGLMARSEIEADARCDFRYARRFIPSDSLKMFDMIVLDGVTVDQAAKRTKCRFSNAIASFRHVALMLHGGIAHMLQVRQL